MDKKQTLMVLSTIKAAYPNQFNKLQEPDFVSMVNVWHSMLGDLDANDVMLAVRKYIMNDSTGFAPAVGQIRVAVFNATHDMLTAEDAWAMVKKLMQRMSDDGFELYKKLPAAVQKAIGGYAVVKGWSQLDSSMVDTTIARQFKEAFRSASETEKELLMLPEADRKKIEEKKNEQALLDWKIDKRS